MKNFRAKLPFSFDDFEAWLNGSDQLYQADVRGETHVSDEGRAVWVEHEGDWQLLPGWSWQNADRYLDSEARKAGWWITRATGSTEEYHQWRVTRLIDASLMKEKAASYIRPGDVMLVVSGAREFLALVSGVEMNDCSVIVSRVVDGGTATVALSREERVYVLDTINGPGEGVAA